MADVLFETLNGFGAIKLNRPKALNALNLSMTEEIHHFLTHAEKNPALSFILIQSTSDKAFCAGGDIRQIFEAKMSTLAPHFFSQEYGLNYKIATLKKPYISLIDGICMGGGLGISVHGKYRIVTEQAILAMPETGIGFFPDVGAAYFLNKLPGNIGLYLGLTGKYLNAQDALFMGLATHFIPHESMKDFLDSLHTTSLQNALMQYSPQNVPGQISEISPHVKDINSFFSKESLEDIMKTLEKSSTPFAQETYEILLKKSPLSLKITLKYFREYKGLPLKTILNQDYVLSQHFMENPDFFEGVRALLIDRDKHPHWSPQNIQDVSAKQVERYFAPQNSQSFNLFKSK